MRLYYVVRPIESQKDGAESISVKIRRVSEHQDDIGVIVSWSRDAKGDWGNAVLAMIAPADFLQKGAMFMYRFSQHVAKLKIADVIDDPDAFIFRLEKDGAKQAVYDPRSHKTVPVDELEAGSSRWKAADVAFEAICESEEAAKKEITKLVKKAMDDAPQEAEKLAKWFTGNLKVVQRKTSGEKPTFTPVKILCKRGHKGAREAEAEMAAQQAEQSKSSDG